MPTNLKPILASFDAFGWIPTLRGALSLDLMGDSGLMWGDVDRYSVAISEYTGLTSQRYLAATSFHNVSDSKYGKNYVRSFRYFFYGSVLNPSSVEPLYADLIGHELSAKESACIKALTENEGILLGRLFIVIEETHTLSDLEVSLIKAIRDLQNAKHKYKYQFSYQADSLDALETTRKDLKRQWEIVRDDINRLGEQDRKLFQFGILLTRDGIMLLKDLTAEASKNIYFQKGTASDYTVNIPIHRIFKTAMNFMKYLFHKNYHHEEEHDTFLPVSNLHPYHENDNFGRIFKHQIDAFLYPLMKLRRKGIKNVNIDPTGIICYSKAFVYACRNNGLIEQEQASRALEYIALQETEITHTARHNRSLLSSLASQRNFFFILSTILAFMVAALKILESGMKLSGKYINCLSNKEWYITAAYLVGLAMIGYLILFFSSQHASKKEFHINKAKQNKLRIRAFLFHGNSNLNGKKLSWRLRTYMWIQNAWNEILSGGTDRRLGKIFIQIVKVIIWSAVVYLIYKGIYLLA